MNIKKRSRSQRIRFKDNNSMKFIRHVRLEVFLKRIEDVGDF